MRLLVTSILLAGGTLAAQTVETPVPAAPLPQSRTAGSPWASAQRPRTKRSPAKLAAKSNAPAVAPSTPLITLRGVCSQPDAQNCETVVTREDLDRYANSSDASEAAPGALAVQYARMTAFSALAEKQGVEKNPVLAKELDAQLKLVRTRILATAFLQSLQARVGTIADADVQKYYADHQKDYEQVQVTRLAVPVAVPTEDGRPLDRQAVQAELAALRVRASAGEDLNQLQREAFTHLRIQAPAPPVKQSKLRRIDVQGDEAKALDLNQGELTEVLDLPAAFAIIKVDSKAPLPLQSVRPEIESNIRAERVQKEVKRLTENISAQFNLQYLGLQSAPDIFGPTVIKPAATRASARRAALVHP